MTMRHDPEQMTRFTRERAREEDADGFRVPTGSHDFPTAAWHHGDGARNLGQLGAGQSNDITGQAPAASMAMQHANPVHQCPEVTDSQARPA